MLYKVGELAELFGISPQTIHHYEKLGLIEPKRDGINRYRYFDEYDFQKLGTIKKLRNAGFPLKDSASVYHRQNEQDVYWQYKQRRREVMEEIEHQLKLVEQLDFYIDKLDELNNGEDSFKVCEMDSFYRYNVTKEKDGIILTKKMIEECTEWYQNLFFTTTSIMFNFKDGVFGNYSVGVIAEKKIFNRFITAKSDDISEIERGLFAVKLFKYFNNIDIDNMQSECWKFLRTTNYELRANPFTRLISTCKDENDNKVNVVELILPIK